MESWSCWCWKGHLEIIWTNVPDPFRITHRRLPRTVFSWVLNLFKDPQPSSATFPVSDHLYSKSLFRIKRSFFYFILCLFPLALMLDTTEKCLALSSLYPPIRYLHALVRFSLSLLLSKWSLSLFFLIHSFFKFTLSRQQSVNANIKREHVSFLMSVKLKHSKKESSDSNITTLFVYMKHCTTYELKINVRFKRWW